MSARETTISLDKPHFKVVLEKARLPGKTPGEYLQTLIDAANTTFNEILAPVRYGFRKSGMTEEQLDNVVIGARKSIHRRSRRKSGE
jgi:hypothetical protein